MREIFDILNRKIEVGDIVLRPLASRIIKVYILDITTKGIWISRAKSTRKYTVNWHTMEEYDYVYTDKYADISEHNDKQYLRFPPDFYILEKNAVIPENLKQFIKLY